MTVTANCPQCGDSLTFEPPSKESDMTAYGYYRDAREHRADWLHWHSEHECPDRPRPAYDEFHDCYSLGQVPSDVDGRL